MLVKAVKSGNREVQRDTIAQRDDPAVKVDGHIVVKTDHGGSVEFSLGKLLRYGAAYQIENISSRFLADFWGA
jgi:hypothetical protein